MAGGAKEVAVLGSWLRLAGQEQRRNIFIIEDMMERQCEHEFVRPVISKYTDKFSEIQDEQIQPIDAILALGCGIGVQAVADCFPGRPVFPGLNTSFMGMPERVGLWVERCHACGHCLLDKTGGVCPIARCAKNLLNGPCGGSQEGKCEIGNQVECAWHLIYERLSSLNQLDRLKELTPPKNWSLHRDGGPRRLIREDWEDV
jgi:hypothetical protein